ncbi:alcohol dehydrogenase catalytic domain-containing protein [Serratia marcescens]|uniref:Zinc-binding dehydrogenase n=1 Tax=Serratia sarumanii TaxID=3020826 RepID=A0ABW8QEM4_9GAMM|nr:MULTISPECIES: alcohol dehydrogenase catalytic domain-containing protein [Serratia]ASL98439.1 erythritol/L-threitol dehydrogenase [Serratia marcescens]EGS9995414.1 alcohol dehydrogenase catalytic domain-containing protein [Serratia marcescens]ELJ5770444.1 alcohol dehydrogenase catalytic domain-containing protein [Serratia marcescens]ELJ5813955.1 alcohol dehydrogenase catalytic domain-containing protein [Serratia marcescens]ELN8907339.1 alcohol dehydrogenase catalytic domain-containing protei
MSQLPEKMRAVVCHGPQDYRFEQVPTPLPKARELVIKVEGCGICAGDCKCKNGAQMFWGENPWVKPPVVPGHEFYGRIAALGEGAEGKYQLGERVIAEQIVPCWECRYCKSGSYWMCETHNIYGFQKDVAEGGMAEYMRFSENAIVHKIPESLSHEDAVLIEPMACAIHTVARGDIQLDDVVVLAGAGPLGLCMVQVARLKTPKKLIVIDAIDERLALAKEFGADVVINPLKEDADQVVKSLTGGYGCDVYIEATGAPIGVTQGLQMIRKLGRFVEFSVFGKETTVDWSIIGDRKELDIRGAHLAPYSYEIAIDLFERGLVTSNGVVTHSYALNDWDEAFALADSTDSIKVILVP